MYKKFCCILEQLPQNKMSRLFKNILWRLGCEMEKNVETYAFSNNLKAYFLCTNYNVQTTTWSLLYRVCMSEHLSMWQQAQSSVSQGDIMHAWYLCVTRSFHATKTQQTTSRKTTERTEHMWSTLHEPCKDFINNPQRYKLFQQQRFPLTYHSSSGALKKWQIFAISLSVCSLSLLCPSVSKDKSGLCSQASRVRAASI